MIDWLIVVMLCIYASAYGFVVLRRGNRLAHYGGQAVVAFGYLLILAPITLIGHGRSWSRRTFGKTWSKFCACVGKALVEVVKAAVAAVWVLGEWVRWSVLKARNGVHGRNTVKVR